MASERVTSMSSLPTIESYDLPARTNLPENKANWQLDPQRAMLLVHDMQNYFLQPFQEQLRTEIVKNTATVCNRCRELGMTVAYTAQPGGMTSSDRGLLKDFWGSGMRATQSQKAIVSQLAPHPADWRLTKWRYSAFIRTRLLEMMQGSGLDQVILSGVYASVGILTTALDAYCKDIQVFVVADALGDFSRDEHYSTVSYISNHCGMALCAKEVLP